MLRMKIESFQGEYRFLSNFFPSLVIYAGRCYTSVEHAYQASKTLNQPQRDAIRAAETPGRAKRMGQKVALRPNWDTYKLDVMEMLVGEKFRIAEDLADLLLATGDAELVEGNTWGDTFWGVCGGMGENHLGRILMRVRAELNER